MTAPKADPAKRLTDSNPITGTSETTPGQRSPFEDAAGTSSPNIGGHYRGPVTNRGRRTRKQLLTTARRLFEERGYTATRMGDIADAAGVAHGTVYTYFEDKTAVLDAVIEDLTDQLAKAWRVGAEDANPITRIDQANRRFLDSYNTHARMLSVVEQMAMTQPKYKTLLGDFRQRYVERAVSGIRRLQTEGKVDSTLDPYLAGSALCAMVEGFGRQWIIRAETHDPQLVTATLTRLWVQALGLDPRPPGSPQQNQR